MLRIWLSDFNHRQYKIFEGFCRGRIDQARFGIVTEAPGMAWLVLNRFPLHTPDEICLRIAEAKTRERKTSFVCQYKRLHSNDIGHRALQDSKLRPTD